MNLEEQLTQEALDELMPSPDAMKTKVLEKVAARKQSLTDQISHIATERTALDQKEETLKADLEEAIVYEGRLTASEEETHSEEPSTEPQEV